MADGLCLMFPPLDWQCSATTSTGKIKFFLVMAEVADLFSLFFFTFFLEQTVCCQHFTNVSFIMEA